MFKHVWRGIIGAASYLPALLRDMFGLLAIGSIAYGSWMLHPAAGFIVGGALVLAGVLLLSRKAL